MQTNYIWRKKIAVSSTQFRDRTGRFDFSWERDRARNKQEARFKMSRSSTGSVNSSSSHSQHHYQQQQHHLNNHKENENLEEDMRKAKESADLLKSVVLPLETEIKKLKNKIKDMENYIKNVICYILEHIVRKVPEP
jgi:hypothetical protein